MTLFLPLSCALLTSSHDISVWGEFKSGPPLSGSRRKWESRKPRWRLDPRERKQPVSAQRRSDSVFLSVGFSPQLPRSAIHVV